MDVVYLTVPFRDKEIVKALGARWDGKNRRWFVAPGNEARFGRWIKEAAASIAGPPTGDLDPPGTGGSAPSPIASTGEGRPISIGPKKGASLSSVLFEASEAIRRAFPVPRWITAEVASIRTNAHSGHTYVELVEHDTNGREMAKASGRIWAGNAKIMRKFEKETGGKLGEGMKVLILGVADFSIQYGFGLTIEDIDSSWTLGEMERKVREIRQRLTDEGLLGANADKPAPKEFLSVAVVAPDGAAGMGDFMADAKALIDCGLCSFRFVPAVFEGSAAKMSLVAALASANELASHGEVDAIAIVRGGGAKTSLNWLNEYEIALQICLAPVPVMTGIGHERDSTVLDEVACESFDTPSKVIGAIVSRIVGNAQAAIVDFEKIINGVGRVCSASRHELTSLTQSLEADAKACLAEQGRQLQEGMTEVAAHARHCLDMSKKEMDHLAREVLGLGPRAVMERGYAVAVQRGVPVSRCSDVEEGSELLLRMSDGELLAHVIMKKGGSHE